MAHNTAGFRPSQHDSPLSVRFLFVRRPLFLHNHAISSHAHVQFLLQCPISIGNCSHSIVHVHKAHTMSSVHFTITQCPCTPDRVPRFLWSLHRSFDRPAQIHGSHPGQIRFEGPLLYVHSSTSCTRGADCGHGKRGTSGHSDGYVIHGLSETTVSCGGQKPISRLFDGCRLASPNRLRVRVISVI